MIDFSLRSCLKRTRRKTLRSKGVIFILVNCTYYMHPFCLWGCDLFLVITCLFLVYLHISVSSTPPLFPPWSLQPGHSIPSPFKVSLVTSLALPYQYHRTSPHLTYVGVACCRALEPNHTCFYMPNVCKCTFCIFLHIFVHFPYLWTFVQIWV